MAFCFYMKSSCRTITIKIPACSGCSSHLNWKIETSLSEGQCQLLTGNFFSVSAWNIIYTNFKVILSSSLGTGLAVGLVQTTNVQ